jgi:hypothetical protein
LPESTPNFVYDPKIAHSRGDFPLHKAGRPGLSSRVAAMRRGSGRNGVPQA